MSTTSLGRHHMWCRKCRLNRVDQRLELRAVESPSRNYLQAKSFALCNGCAEEVFDAFVESCQPHLEFSPEKVYATVED